MLVSSEWSSVVLAASEEELVNQESGVWRPSEVSRKTELTVLKTWSLVARKERVLGWLHEGHCHGCLGSILFLKSDGIFIFLDILIGIQVVCVVVLIAWGVGGGTGTAKEMAISCLSIISYKQIN